MWFEALRGRPASPWFVSLCRRLLEGSPAVLGLLERSPFPDKPPRFLRTLRLDYRFTSFDEKRASGAWWKRSGERIYIRPIMLDDFKRE